MNSEKYSAFHSRDFVQYCSGLLNYDGRKTITRINGCNANKGDQSSLNRFLTTSPWNEEALNYGRIIMMNEKETLQGVKMIIRLVSLSSMIPPIPRKGRGWSLLGITTLLQRRSQSSPIVWLPLIFNTETLSILFWQMSIRRKKTVSLIMKSSRPRSR